MARSALVVLGVLVVGLGLPSCGRDATAPPVSVSLVAAPDRLSLTDSAASGSVYLTASASGGRLDWQLTSAPAWVTVTPTKGTIRDEPVTLTVSAPGLATAEPGTLQGTLDFVSNGGAAHIVVAAQVSANPLVSFSDTTLTVPAASDTGTITLKNSGHGPLAWSASVSLSTLEVVPSSGTLATGEQVTLAVVADKGPLPVGTTAATLTIASNSRLGTATLPISVVVPATPRVDVPIGRLVFAAGVIARDFFVRNLGKGPLHWSATADVGWLVLAPTSGQVAAGDSARVTATVDRSAAPNGTDATATVTITGDGVVSRIPLPVLLTSSASFPIGLTVLDHRVVDAEYSAAAGRIVTVSANPSQLNILDVATGKIGHVPLSLPPSCVAVRPDGAYAAVGHDGYISYVDLAAQKVVRTYAVTTSVLDIVLPSNGWVYAMPAHDQWESVRSIDLSTGKEEQTSGIYAGALARLHPSGDYLYVPWNGLSPDNIDKYDIRSGVATPLWESPYWGDYSFGGLIWFSEDGTRIFARSGNVFRASDVRSEDMFYAGSLVGAGRLNWAADSRQRGRVYVLSSESPTGVRVYDSQYLAFLGTVPLPPFATPSGPVPSTGYYLFPSENGDRIYVLAKAQSDAGLAEDWGLIVLDGGALP